MLGFLFKKKKKKVVVESNGEVRIIVFDNRCYFVTISELYSFLKDSGIIGKEFDLIINVGSFYHLVRNRIRYAKRNFEGVDLKTYSGIKSLLRELVILYEEALKIYKEGHYDLDLEVLKQDVLNGV